MTDPDLLPDLSTRSDAYGRMADALAHIGETWTARPNLAACAQAVGLSPSHFQREFARWAGLSPKQVQGAYAHSAAGDALRDGADVMEAAFEAGLSGPGRLHDLFIAHEALTPGEAKSGGGGVRLTIGIAPTPFGRAAFVIAPRGLAGLGFIDDAAQAKTGFEHPGYDEVATLAQMKARYPSADWQRDDRIAQDWAERVFVHDRPVPLALYGSPFRRQIWRALLDIPAGQTARYGEIAARAGHPKAARAAGAAVGANPIAWCIPCHRVLSSDLRLHNYHWGKDRKRAMLTLEAVGAGS